MRFTAIIIFLLLAPARLAVADDPVIAADIYKPTFLFLDDSFTAGTSFFVGTSDQKHVVLVTCDHLFGPDGGLQQQMTPDDIVQQIHGAVALSMQDQRTIIAVQTYVKVVDALPLSANDFSKDLALFTFSNTPSIKFFKLADSMPKNGDRVWMYSRIRDTNEPKLFPATVSESTDAQLRYVFDEPSLNLAGTSGSPVLNQNGEVVGMNLGGGTTSDKKVYGAANPASSIAKEIAIALSH